MLAVADDPELRRLLGIGALNHEFFCPFCKKRLSELRCRDFSPAPPRNMREAQRHGKQAAPLSRLLQERSAIMKQRSGLDPLKLSKTQNQLSEAAELKRQYDEKTEECKICLGKIIEKDKDSVTEAYITQFYHRIYNQRYPPTFPHLHLHQYCACGFHCHCNITSNIFKHTCQQITPIPHFLKEFKARLLKLGLHYLHSFVEGDEKADWDTKFRKLMLIGRDCRKLEDSMVSLLEGMLAHFRDKLSSTALEQFFSPLISMWREWAGVAPYLRMKTLSDPSEVSVCKEKAQAFVKNFTAKVSDVHITRYMHFLHDHLWEWMDIYYKEFGFGYGVLTTQSMEHRLKLFKRDLRHTLQTERMWELSMRHQHQRMLGGLELPQPNKRIITCGKCGQIGHQQNNKKCTQRVQQ